MMPVKTQTIRVSPEIHRLAKTAASNASLGLQVWIENLIKKECKIGK